MEQEIINAKELTLTRIIKAPRALVFKAWTDPKLIAAWWGPKGFTSPVCEIDARAGGAILIDMKAPDGTIYPMDGMYKKIEEPERIVFISGALNQNGKKLFEVLNTVTFFEEGENTKLVLHAIVSKIMPGAMPYLDGMNEGWSQSLERLEDYMQNLNADLNNHTSNRELKISRLLNAPRELVWKVFTEPGHIKNWWGPNGFTNTIFTMDVQPGGVWDFVMHGPDGTDYKNKSIYSEIIQPEKIVFKHVTGPKFTTTITFEKQGSKTLLTWRMLFDTAEELTQVIKVFKADEGLKQNIIKLESYLMNM
jgi:uncharacterized protein YndB with AHSA1/START domain